MGTIARTKVTKNNLTFIAVDKSSTIKGLSYDKTTKILNITFKNGSVYSYYGVHYNRFNAFARSESVGKYFAKNIKGKYLNEKRTFVIANEIVKRLSNSFS